MRTVTTVETLDRYGKTVSTVVTTVESDEPAPTVINRDALQLDGRAVYEALQRFKRINGGILNLT